MKPFPLKILTPEGIFYDGQAEGLVVRAVSGDMGILADHINCVAPLRDGRVMVTVDENRRLGSTCSGGILYVHDGTATLISTAFAWEEK